MKKVTIIMMILLTGIMVSAYKSKSNHKQKMTAQASINQTLDSIHWLIERHCDNMTKMEYDDGTIGEIVAKFKSLPPNIADSILQAQYDYMVTLFEQERNRRAYAIADCYYVLAKDNDPNLGALYLNDIVLSTERNDTTMLRKRISDLKAYSERNNLDYDQDIAEAEYNMDLVKRRIHFNASPVSTYVHDDTMWLLDIRNLTPDQLGWLGHLDLLMSVGGEAVGLCGMKEYSLKVDKRYASLQEPWSLSLYEYTSRKDQLDERTKTFFAALGTEMGGNPNPQLLASSRQTIQNLHAQISGELARKKYSYGKRIGGELITSAIDLGLNALLDRSSATTQTAIRKEVTLTLTQPELLEGFMINY